MLSGTARHVVVMGVSGCGKTTLAQALSRRLAAKFTDADSHHSDGNIAKMSAGIPLDDDDRRPWLDSLTAWIDTEERSNNTTVLACSALKRSYRDTLRTAAPALAFVHLEASPDVIAARLRNRPGHFMPQELLDSQFTDLQPLQPDEIGLTIDALACRDHILRRVLDGLAQPRKVPT